MIFRMLPFFTWALIPLVFATVIPPPGTLDYKGKGEYSNCSIAQLELSDPSTKDPYDGNENRKLVVSLFYPIYGRDCTETCNKPYMPGKAAGVSNKQFFGDENIKVFDNIQFEACCAANVPLYAKQVPVIILEPGVGTSRHLYGALAQHISSIGFAVVTIDHPHDSSIVEFASRYSAITKSVDLNPFEPIKAWNDTVTKAVQARVKDINFVLNQLKDKTVVDKLLPGFDSKEGFNTDSVGIVGHGLGGSVATALGVDDPRFKLSINMGGTPPKLTSDTYKPIVFFGREDYRREDDIHWLDTWKHLRGKATEWDLQSAGPYDFSDLPLIKDIAETDIPVETNGLGAIGPRALETVAVFAEAYMRMEWGHDEDALTLQFQKHREMVPYPGLGERED